MPIVKATAYVYGSKERAWELGEEIGLSEEAIELFKHALTEFKLTLLVDTTSGESEVIEIDGRRVQS